MSSDESHQLNFDDIDMTMDVTMDDFPDFGKDLDDLGDIEGLDNDFDFTGDGMDETAGENEEFGSQSFDATADSQKDLSGSNETVEEARDVENVKSADGYVTPENKVPLPASRERNLTRKIRFKNPIDDRNSETRKSPEFVSKNDKKSTEPTETASQPSSSGSEESARKAEPNEKDLAKERASQLLEKLKLSSKPKHSVRKLDTTTNEALERHMNAAKVEIPNPIIVEPKILGNEINLTACLTGISTALQSNEDALATYKKLVGDFEAGYFALKHTSPSTQVSDELQEQFELIKARAEVAAIKRAEAAKQLRELDEKRNALRKKIEKQLKESAALREQAQSHF